MHGDKPAYIHAYMRTHTHTHTYIQTNQLQYALPEGTIHNSLVVLCVDASSPWTVPTALNDWSKIVGDYVRAAAGSDARRVALRKCVEAWNREYKDEAGGGDGDSSAKIHGIDAEELPLKDGCLEASSLLSEFMPECEQQHRQGRVA